MDIMNKSDAKREKFKQISEKRVNSILQKLKILGNLSNKSNYYYENEDVIKIFQAIEKATKEVKERFLNTEKDSSFKFKW